MYGFLFSATCWAAVPLTALLGLGCLLCCRGRRRRQLGWAAAVFCGALLLLAGGGLVLGQLDLAWRTAPALALLWILLLSGMAGSVLTLRCLLPLEMKALGKGPRRLLKGAAAVSAGLIVFFALAFGFIWTAFRGQERVITYQGQRLVELDSSFLDPIYDYYAYHGPLVRGNESLYGMHETHIYGDES